MCSPFERKRKYLVWLFFSVNFSRLILPSFILHVSFQASNLGFSRLYDNLLAGLEPCLPARSSSWLPILTSSNNFFFISLVFLFISKLKESTVKRSHSLIEIQTPCWLFFWLTTQLRIKSANIFLFDCLCVYLDSDIHDSQEQKIVKNLPRAKIFILKKFCFAENIRVVDS